MGDFRRFTILASLPDLDQSDWPRGQSDWAESRMRSTGGALVLAQVTGC
jgi:hypothetical protein